MIKTISDIISIDEIQSWTPERAVFISASTGKGKSHFIKNKLYDYAKARDEKILLILHRKNCYMQFDDELSCEGKIDVISTITYQSIEQQALGGVGFDFSRYTYIVCDEYHYFLEDSDFNPNTDTSFQAIIHAKKITLWLSATGHNMKEYITVEQRVPYVEYELIEEDTHIRSLNFFEDMESTAIRLARKVISSGEKAIFFIQSAEKAKQLKQALGKDAIFNCSQYNKNYRRSVNLKLIEKILQEEAFDVPIMVTTACFDAGINIRDKAVKTIFVDITNVASAIQCIGRRRIDYNDPNDRIDVYVHVPPRRSINGIISGKSSNLDMANYLIDNGPRAFIQKYRRKSYPSLIYYNSNYTNGDDFMCVNKIKYYKDLVDIRDLRDIMSVDHGYQNKIAELLRCVDHETGEYRYNEVDSDGILTTLLESFVDRVMLTPTDREPLIQALNVCWEDQTLRRAAALNEALERRNFPYQIVSFRTSRMENGKKVDYGHAWRVERR